MNLTRRDAIRKTVCFSSAMLAEGLFSRVGAQPRMLQPERGGLHFLAVGDFGSANKEQVDVANQMSEFAKQLKAPLAGVLVMGDNFYGKFKVERFQSGFEEMYSKKTLDCDFYICLGNHDYEHVGKGEAVQLNKADYQLRYAAENPQSRWKLPAKWYVQEFKDSTGPLVRVIVLDGNTELTQEEIVAQERFLEAELERKTSAPWTWMINHFPLFTSSVQREDDPRLIGQLGPYLKKHKISHYLAGHDHSLQHLEIEGYNTSFVISGGGGRALHEVKMTERGFTRSQLGFNHIHVDRQAVTTRYIDEKGNILHTFKRDVAGKVEII